MWPTLKMFVHGMYGQRLVTVQLRDTSGQWGHVPTHHMYNVLGKREGNTNTNNNATATTITQTAAVATTGSTLGNTYAGTHVPIHSKVSSAINQLLANQAALFQQMVVLLFHALPQQNSIFSNPPYPNPHYPRHSTAFCSWWFHFL
jgi:hypothetical protein